MLEHTRNRIDPDATPEYQDVHFLREAAFDVGHQGFLVCATCGELFRREGRPATDTPQKCHCHRSPEDEPWEGFDFNECARLCLCCGRVALRSGSRWSPWFCNQCKEPIRGFNITHAWGGVPIIPQGRHSAMNQLFLTLEETEDIRKVTRFTEESMGLVGRSSDLFTYGRERVKENLRLVGLDAHSVALREYLVATGRAALADPRLGREAALLGLMAHFGVQATRDDLPYYRERLEEWKKRFHSEK